MDTLPARRSVRLRGFDYRHAGAYFATVCTFRRACILADIVEDQIRLTAAGRVIESAWQMIPEFFPHVELDWFVVMPNHLHGILILHDALRAKHPIGPDASPLQGSRPRGTRSGTLSAVMQTAKAMTTRRVHAIPGMEGIRLWQRGFYDHVIRGDTELNRIRSYIEENPLRWALDNENPSRSPS
jgi:REP element-mobilizing transposase RayT